ncbi:MAG TPA: hypothetical protein VKA07_03455 [Candidatus Sulfotelmatobacter sp.]|nr:hypothetical protein [Candidatus Sulfotelmatobacter sp.]
MRVNRLAIVGALFLTSLLMAQQALDNAAVVKMAKAGLGDDVIVSMVQNQPGHYALTPDTLVSLKKDGVSDKVLAAMAAKNAAPVAAPAAAAAAAKDPYDDLDIGVYYKLKDVWTLIPSESVNWKTGGVLKSFASQGIVKGDVNGHLNGKQSATELRTPMEILIKTAEGVEATDYQLVHMHANSDNREFRTKTGGVFHASGGSTKDAVQFQQTRIAKHVYTVTLPDKLASGGEYGFLAPGLTNSTASGSTGKAYTFHFLE